MTKKISICMRDKEGGLEGADLWGFVRQINAISFTLSINIPSAMDHLSMVRVYLKHSFNSNPFPNQRSNSDPEGNFQPAVTRVATS